MTKNKAIFSSRIYLPSKQYRACLQVIRTAKNESMPTAERKATMHIKEKAGPPL